MPLGWKAQPKDVYWNWIDTILEEAEETLTDWERNFIDSIQERLKFRNLTEREAIRLEEIYVKKTH